MRKGTTMPLRVLAAVAVRVARRPGLWPAGLRQLRSMAAPGWWRRPPFLPLPPADYAAFRAQTMWGGAGVLPSGPETSVTADQLVHWLAWSGEERRARGR
ncbi:MAG: hypothetical protein R2755_05975 [Acidimicrobiales bacterium]